MSCPFWYCFYRALEILAQGETIGAWSIWISAEATWLRRRWERRDQALVIGQVATPQHRIPFPISAGKAQTCIEVVRATLGNAERDQISKLNVFLMEILNSEETIATARH